MYCQSITTKFLGPTNRTGARVKASAPAGSVIVPWNHGLSQTQNHIAAAECLIRKLGWGDVWAVGGSADGCGIVCVWLGPIDPSDLLADCIDCRAVREDCEGV